MDQVKLFATRRNRIGKQVSHLRREGKLPAILYGKSIEKPIPVTLDGKETAKIMRRISSSSLVVISVDGEELTTLVRDFQIDPLRGELRHVDFLVVSLTETVRTSVGIHLVGEAPVIIRDGGLIMTTTETVEVEALPQDLPQHMEIDVSVLENFGDALYVRDLVAPPNVTILTDPDDLLVVAQAPSEEVIPEGAPLEAGAEVVEEEAEEAEEGEEGEEAEGGEAAEEGGE